MTVKRYLQFDLQGNQTSITSAIESQVQEDVSSIYKEIDSDFDTSKTYKLNLEDNSLIDISEEKLLETLRIKAKFLLNDVYKSCKTIKYNSLVHSKEFDIDWSIYKSVIENQLKMSEICSIDKKVYSFVLKDMISNSEIFSITTDYSQATITGLDAYKVYRSLLLKVENDFLKKNFTAYSDYMISINTCVDIVSLEAIIENINNKVGFVPTLGLSDQSLIEMTNG